MRPPIKVLFGAGGVGMGLAAGVSLGTFLARPLRARRLDKAIGRYFDNDEFVDEINGA